MYEPGNRRQPPRLQKGATDLDKALLHFTVQDEVNTTVQIVAGMIGSIGSVCYHRESNTVSDGGQLVCQVAHVRQAHLGYEVEVVFMDDNDLRTVLLKGRSEAGDGLGEHRVVYTDRNTGGAQCGCRIQRTERRIRLHLPELFCVAGKVVGVRQQYVCHRSPPGEKNSAGIRWLPRQCIARNK